MLSRESDEEGHSCEPHSVLSLDSMNVQETPYTTDVEIGGIRTRGSFQVGQSETRVPITFKDLKAPRSLLALRPHTLPARGSLLVRPLP
mmetsp:Transcript_5860/g.19282  ORF Transcript_5860/g.19282 Transcript_5860/m.19282 type:complete len:89 (-) Transcript_5860:937-1203(-)